MKQLLTLILLFVLTQNTIAQNVGIGTTTPKASFNVGDNKTVLFGLVTSGGGSKLIWYANKGAFRAGWTEINEWDIGYVGQGSFAGGYATEAQGNMSMAMGKGSKAMGGLSTALGSYSNASGYISTAIGHVATAPSYIETVIGSWNTIYTPAGQDHWVPTDRLFTIGNGNPDLSSRSDAMVVLKNGNTGIGTSTPGAKLDISSSGAPQLLLTQTDPTDFSRIRLNILGKRFWDIAGLSGATIADDRLNFYNIGGGNAVTITGDRKLGIDNVNPNAPLAFAGTIGKKITLFPGVTGDIGLGVAVNRMQLYADSPTADVAIGYDAAGTFNESFAFKPTGALAVKGDVGKGGQVLVSSGAGSAAGWSANKTILFGADTSGGGSKLIWYGAKSAFRAGYLDANSDKWNSYNTGLYSFATGYNAMASGELSTAIGFNNVASGTFSFALGPSDTASGVSSIAMNQYPKASGFMATAIGAHTTASATNSTAIGTSAVASGLESTSIGDGTSAPSFAETSVGSYNTDYTPASITQWNPSDHLFTIGNGRPYSKSDALVVLKNGNTGFGTSNPLKKFEVVGTASSAPVALVIGNKGGFGAAALEFVSNYGDVIQWRPGYIQSNDAGGFTGRLEFYTNGTGSTTLYNSVKGFEVTNGKAYTATGAVFSFSDARLKNNITPFTDGLNIISKINPVNFYYNADAPFKTGIRQTGIVAQELEVVAPYMVEKNKEAGYEDLRSVNNQAYTFLLINAVKELKSQNEQQQKEIDELKNMVYQLIKK